MAIRRLVSTVIYSPVYVKLRYGYVGKMASTNQNNCTNGVEEDADGDMNRELVLSGLRSSSPSRPPNDGFAETNREEGIITRSASKRKGIYEQLSSHFKQG